MTASTNLIVFRHAARKGFTDLTAIYTWKTWTFGWLARLITQVIFFALIGRLLGSQAAVHYLLIGHAVAVAALDATIVILTTAGERRSGTLPTLVAAPATHLTVFLGQGVHWPTTGVVSALITLLIGAPLFDLALPWPRTLLVVPLVVLVAVSCYLFGTFVGGFCLRVLNIEWLALNLSYLGIMTFCGVNVPVDYWPGWIEAVATVLPLTHGLAAIRALLDGAPLASLIPQVVAEAGVGVGWLALAMLSFHRLAESGRRDGSIEFAA